MRQLTLDSWRVSITRQHGSCWRARVSTTRVDSGSGRKLGFTPGIRKSPRRVSPPPVNCLPPQLPVHRRQTQLQQPPWGSQQPVSWSIAPPIWPMAHRTGVDCVTSPCESALTSSNYQQFSTECPRITVSTPSQPLDSSEINWKSKIFIHHNIAEKRTNSVK